uniref:Uncharacterized protein n=1 Tax=Tanacetum cinerariifolium TaxID=118510 RepID=A0A6L2LGU1_TANCI|nr:hypothetical protein [Tanacetum cinerariifolium]
MKAKLAFLEAIEPKNNGLVAEIFDWDKEEIFDEEEVTQVKVLMALADDELTVGKNHARNGEWLDITMRNLNTHISMDEDADWQNYLKNYNPKGERFLIASRFPTPPLACAFFSPGATVNYRLNPRYAIKECLSCGALYTEDFCCSKGNVEDMILVPKLPKNYARCAKCGHPVNGPYSQGCTLLREKLEEDLVTYFQNFQNTSKSSDDSTNVVNAPREPFVVKKDHSVNPPQIDECCCECGNALDGIFCQQCTCKPCGKGAHIGYNWPPKVLIISNPEPCNQTMNNELPQSLPSFDTTCYSDKENSIPCVSKPNFVDESSNIFNPPSQPPIYSCEFCGSNAQYGHYCTPQVMQWVPIGMGMGKKLYPLVGDGWVAGEKRITSLGDEFDKPIPIMHGRHPY